MSALECEVVHISTISSLIFTGPRWGLGGCTRSSNDGLLSCRRQDEQAGAALVISFLPFQRPCKNEKLNTPVVHGTRHYHV